MAFAVEEDADLVSIVAILSLQPSVKSFERSLINKSYGPQSLDFNYEGNLSG